MQRANTPELAPRPATRHQAVGDHVMRPVRRRIRAMHRHRRGDRRRMLGHSGSLVPLKVGRGQEGDGRSPLRRGPIATHPARLVVVGGRRNRLPARLLRAGRRAAQRRIGRLESGAGALAVLGESGLPTRYPGDEARPARRSGVKLPEDAQRGGEPGGRGQAASHRAVLDGGEERRGRSSRRSELEANEPTRLASARRCDRDDPQLHRDENGGGGGRGDDRRAHPRGETGPGRRSSLARSCQPGRPYRALGRGGVLARGLPAAAPDDPAVWNSRLDWAWENDRVDLVRQALGHIPINRSSSRRVDALRAWFARHRGDIRGGGTGAGATGSPRIPEISSPSNAWPCWPSVPGKPIAPLASAAASRNSTRPSSVMSISSRTMH